MANKLNTESNDIIDFVNTDQRKKYIKKLKSESKQTGIPIQLISYDLRNGKFRLYLYHNSFEVMKNITAVLTRDNVRDIIEAETDGEKKMMMKILAYTGRRVSEVVFINGIRPRDINADDNIINFVLLKKRGTKKKRYPIPVVSWLIKELKEYCETYRVDKKDLIFPRRREWAFSAVKEAAIRAGVELENERNIHPHHFRHFFAVTLARSAQTPDDVFQIQNMLGHSDIKTTQFYIKHFNNKRSTVMLNDAFKKDV